MRRALFITVCLAPVISIAVLTACGGAGGKPSGAKVASTTDPGQDAGEAGRAAPRDAGAPDAGDDIAAQQARAARAREECSAADEFAAQAKLVDRNEAREQVQKLEAQLASLLQEVPLDGGAAEAATITSLASRATALRGELDAAKKRLANLDEWVIWYGRCLQFADEAWDERVEDAISLGGVVGYSLGADQRDRFTAAFVVGHVPATRLRLEYRAFVGREYLDGRPFAFGLGASLVWGRSLGLYVGADAALAGGELVAAPKLGLAIRPLWSLRGTRSQGVKGSAWFDTRLFLQPVVTTHPAGDRAILFGVELGTGYLMPN